MATAALTGTITASVVDSDIVTGGKTIILTLTGDTFVAAGTGPIGATADTQALIDGLVSDGYQWWQWDTHVTPNIATTDVVRTSDTVATITLPAIADYKTATTETITATIPAAVLTAATPIVASPTFTIDRSFTTKPIAHWTDVPMRRVAATEQIGVVCAHKGTGISKVTFSINGGAGVDVNTPTEVTDTDFNGKTTTHYEYQITFDPSLYSDGAVTFDATVVPVTGTSRVLPQKTLHANSGGTLDGSVIYMDTAANGGSDANAGTSVAPVENFKRAMELCSATGGDIIELKSEATYNFVAGLDVGRHDLDFWTTIRAASGLTRANVIISNSAWGLMRPFHDRLKFEGLSLDFGLIQQLYSEDAAAYASNPDRRGDVYWTHDCKFYNSNGWADPRTGFLPPVRSRVFVDGYYATNCLYNDMVEACHQVRMAKGCHVKRISGDSFFNIDDFLILNCSGNEIDGTARSVVEPSLHPDLCQLYGSVENAMVYNFEVTDINSCQALHFDQNDTSYDNVALINYDAEVVPGDVLAVSAQAKTNHLLMWHVAIPEQGLFFRDDNIGAAQFIPTDTDVRNCIFRTISNGTSPTLLSGMTLDYCHTNDAASTIATNSTFGDVTDDAVGILGDFTYSGADTADIDTAGDPIADVNFPDWTFSSAIVPNKGAWPQSAWIAAIVSGGRLKAILRNQLKSTLSDILA